MVAAFEAGADAEADHRRAHRRQGEDARGEEVDRLLRVRRQHVDEAEEHEQQHRDAERQQQLLTVAGNTAQLGAQLDERRASSLAHVVAAGQPAEDVLEALPAGAQVVQRMAGVGQPIAELGHQPRLRVARR